MIGANLYGDSSCRGEVNKKGHYVRAIREDVKRNRKLNSGPDSIPIAGIYDLQRRSDEDAICRISRSMAEVENCLERRNLQVRGNGVVYLFISKISECPKSNKHRRMKNCDRRANITKDDQVNVT